MNHPIRQFCTARTVIAFLLTVIFQQAVAQDIDPERITIYRDSFGVAHIHAPTDAEAAYGFAWAQAEDDFKTIQLTMLPIRGRNAEYSGKSGAILDVAAAMIGVDTIVDQQYEKQLSPGFRKIVEAFAAGMTAYGNTHQDELLLKNLLPFTGKDVIKGYLFETAFLTGLQQPLEDVFGNRLEVLDLGGPTGSNAFAFSPNKTEDGLTYFCSNSHQPLESSFSWYEAHVISDEGWNVLGATFPGGVTPFVGTNEHLGWTHTVNHPDFVDVYQLEMHSTEKLTYRYDGEWLRLTEEKVKLNVKLPGGIKLPVTQKFYRSVYGLTIKNDQGFFSIRFAANQAIGASEQWYNMNKATNLAEFKAALQEIGIPGTNIIYADKEGNIFYVGNARLPVRNEGFEWSGLLPGNTSQTRWTSFHEFETLPQVLNPACGWLFNSNNTPFTSTAFPDAPTLANMPTGHGYLTTENNRSLRFFEQMEEVEKISWEKFLEIKYDLHYSDSLFDPVITNWKELMDLDSDKYPELAEEIIILKSWDLNTDIESVGATLFLLCWNSMYQRLQPQGLWKHGYVAEEAEFVTALAEAQKHLMKYFGKIIVPLGDFQRHRRGEVDLPVGGGPNILAAMYAAEGKDGRFESKVGDGFIQFVKYDQTGPVLIQTMMPYGASSKPDSPHYTDQMEMYVNQQLKEMTLDMEMIKAQATSAYHPGD